MLKSFIETTMDAQLSFREEVDKATGEKLFVTRGIGQRADAVNENNRRYSRKLWENVFGTNWYKADLEGGRLLGQLGHPKDGVMDLSDASHYTHKIEMDKDGTIWVENIVMNTPKGEIVKTIFRSGVKLGQSSRGDGESTVVDGVENLNESNYRLRAWDYVTDPSVTGAFPEIISESTNPDGSINQTVLDLLSNIEKRVSNTQTKGEELHGYKVLLESVGLDPVRSRVLDISKVIDERLAVLTPKLHSQLKSGGISNMKRKIPVRKTESWLTFRHSDQPSRGLIRKYRAAEECLAVALDEGKKANTNLANLKIENKQLTADNDKLKREMEAAESLIDVSLEDRKLTVTIESLVAGNPNADFYREILKGASSKSAAERMFTRMEAKLNPDFKKTKEELSKKKSVREEKSESGNPAMDSMVSTARRMVQVQEHKVRVH